MISREKLLKKSLLRHFPSFFPRRKRDIWHLPPRNDFLQGVKGFRHTFPFPDACRLNLKFLRKTLGFSQNIGIFSSLTVFIRFVRGFQNITQSQTTRARKRTSVPDSSYSPEEIVPRWQKPCIPLSGEKRWQGAKK